MSKMVTQEMRVVLCTNQRQKVSGASATAVPALPWVLPWLEKAGEVFGAIILGIFFYEGTKEDKDSKDSLEGWGDEQNEEDQRDGTNSKEEPDTIIDEKRVGHIFRDSEGHMSEDTEENRQRLEDAANNKDNYLGKDAYGNEWYAENNPDGTQTWVQVRNGKIINGGVNNIPKEYNPNIGLSRSTKPSQK